MRLWSLIPEPFRLYAAIGLLALVVAAGAIVYSHIYQRGYDAATVAAQAKLDQMQAANDRAIAAAEKTLREDVAELKLQKDNLENEVAKLDAEGAADPDANECGIGVGSVQRLNAVR